MRHLLSRLLLLPLALLLVAPLSGMAKPVRTDYVESELVLRHGAAEPGGKVLAGLRLKMDAHWHTYWQNPGDSGMPTTIQWKLPPGFKAGQIQWPAPQKLPIPPLMNYGYEGEIVLPVELSVPKDWPAGQVARIAARADWLVCKDVCLPGGADLEVSLPVVTGNAAPERKWAALFDAALAKLPTQKIAGATATTADGLIELTLPGIKAANLGGLYVFPIIESLVEPAAAQTVEVVGDGIKFTLMVSKQLAASEPRISGVVVGAGTAALAAPLAFEAPMSGKLIAGKGIPDAPGMTVPAVAPAADQLSLGLAILFALLGGMILNLMPCVFPVLSLKILSFARGGPAASLENGAGNSVSNNSSNGTSTTQAAQSRAAMRVQGVAFAVGVIASFVVLAAILLGLRAAGEAVGWGFQLQSPLVVTLLALLFFLIGLNLSGVFAFGNLLPGNLAAATLKHPTADALLSGVLAALVASPCTAPFMGAALGFAMTQSTVAALTVFAAMGVGMALPYVLLSFFPAWLKRLPRPGPWLDTFKQAMAFPMYATVVWLAWVLLVQVGADGMVWFGTGLVVIGFGAWLLGRSSGATGRLTALVAILAGVFAANLLPPTVSGTTSSASPMAQAPGQAASGWQPYSRTALAELGAKGTPVFVDFTAAWCVTCQVNKKVVLETRAVQEAFAGKKVALMRADWTRRDPEITAALAAFGRNGVPVYALYAPGKAPVLLPELLTERIVLDALQSF